MVVEDAVWWEVNEQRALRGDETILCNPTVVGTFVEVHRTFKYRELLQI